MSNDPVSNQLDREKDAAAKASLRYVNDGDIVGLGTGSTAAFMVRALAEKVRAGLKIVGIPTSKRTEELAASLGIAVTTLDEYQDINVTIDGADEFDSQLRLIKGGGGALLREKIVASASRKLVIIADSSKQARKLGRFPLPVEVIPFAEKLVARKIVAMGAQVKLREYAYGNPFVTDEGHHILDCHFGEIDDPEKIGSELSFMPGIVEHGLFLNMASVVVVGKADGVVELTRK
ncbi:MAG: ribose 5-phosphate isomerase A [Acidobacteria bacterium]|nr:MAG: ribose 5-phosphate isomerase A [Acidobacteriota bacterium]